MECHRRALNREALDPGGIEGCFLMCDMTPRLSMLLGRDAVDDI